MRKQRILGISLIVLAFVFLFGFIVLPVIPQIGDAPVFDSVLGAVLCAPDQTLVRDPYSQTFGSETTFSMDVYCQDAQGERIDVTGKWGPIGLVGYLVLFLPGMYVTTGALQKNRQKKKQENVPHSAHVPEQIAKFQRRVRAQDAAEDGSAKIVTKGGGANFTDKLKQIQEARDNGLIDDEEYEHLRQKILDDME